MDSATRQMLETVDKRIANLQQIRRLIVEEFGESRNGAITPARRTRKRKAREATTNEHSRKDQIHAWLKKNGPSSRAEIIKGTGFPDGTVGAYLSTEKDLFENRDGKWHAR